MVPIRMFIIELLHGGTGCSQQYRSVHVLLMAALNCIKSFIPWSLHPIASNVNVIVFSHKDVIPSTCGERGVLNVEILGHFI
jgi:hypothetical protein